MDYYKNPGEYLLKIVACKNLERVEDVYHTRPKSLRLLFNYFPIVGPHGMLMKTWSRLREAYRNEKYVSCGVGEIVETAENGKFKKGDFVGFVAPLHPALAERITLPEELILSIDKSEIPKTKNKVLYQKIDGSEKENWWKDIMGWSIYSGIEINEKQQKEIAEKAGISIKGTSWENAEKMPVETKPRIISKKGEVKKRISKAKTGILFGYGNYAKINIIPYSKPYVDIRSVHEIDPTQIMMERKIDLWDTSPFPAKDEKYDVFFIASYNHTHHPITMHALKQGAYAVVEKPVVMDYEELDELEKVLKESDKGIFIGFHKRYGRFNRYALEDLGVKYGDPISYHSIVYELLQPKYFWYNWPVSRSTFFANGCHQIDHFLHLNNFSKPTDFGLKLSKDKSVEVWIELENGAFFTTTFSEKGSSRIGPRDVVELKVPNKNIRIIDNIKYLSEDNHRIIRKKRIFKTESYREMYQEIGRKIAKGERGDSLESIMVSTKLMLDLEEELKKAKGWGDKYEKAKERFQDYFGSK